MRINNRKELEFWLDKNYWFEDGYVSKIQSDSEGLIITLGFQVEGTYVAGEPKTLKEYDIKPVNVKKWTFKKSEFEPSYDWCIEGVDLVKEGVGLKFETPNVFELVCDGFEIAEPKEIKTFTKPTPESNSFFVSTTQKEIPKPQFWIESFAKSNLKIGLRVYGGELKEVDKVPYPDYSGYFLQQRDNCKNNNYGIFIKSVSAENERVSFVFELKDEELKLEWLELQKIVACWNGVIVNSGNVKFENNEWKNYIENGELPRGLDKLKTGGNKK